MRVVSASWNGILRAMMDGNYPILANEEESRYDRSLIPERIKWVLEDQERAEEHGLVWLPDIFCWASAEFNWHREKRNLKQLNRDINRRIYKDTWMRDYEPYTTICRVNYIIYNFMLNKGIKLDIDIDKYDFIYFKDLYQLSKDDVNSLCEEIERKYKED